MGDYPAFSGRYLSFAAMTVSQAAVDQAIQRVLSRIAADRFRRSTGPLDLGRIYDIDPPRGGAHLFRLVIYTPRQSSADCVLVTNLVDGWNSLCHILAKEHGEFQFQAISTRANVEYPSNRIEVWNNGKSIRKVIAMRDSDEWEFLQRGEPQDFEEQELYEKRVISERLNREAIYRYARKIGWDISKRSFWEASTEATYFEETSKRTHLKSS